MMRQHTPRRAEGKPALRGKPSRSKVTIAGALDDEGEPVRSFDRDSLPVPRSIRRIATPIWRAAARLLLALPDGPRSVTAGTLPFGNYETNLVLDPLTLKVGETGETTLEWRVEFDGIQRSVFAFSTNDQGGGDRISDFGAAAVCSVERFSVNVFWIKGLGEADDFVEQAAGDQCVAGWMQAISRIIDMLF